MIWFDLPELLPPVYRLVKALEAAAEAENEVFKKALTAFKSVQDNFYFQSCDLTTLKVWENLLGLNPYDGETIAERRSAVIMFLNNQEPYTVRFLKRNLELYLGNEGEKWILTEYPERYSVDLFFLDTNQVAQDQMTSLATRIKPAHINLNSGVFVKSPSTNIVSMNASCDHSATATCQLAPYNCSVYDAETQTLYNGVDNPTAETITYNGQTIDYAEFYEPPAE